MPDSSASDDPTKAPSDVKAAPADADKTDSGIAHKVITKGTGTEHPRAFDMVEVHYSGWTPDGKNFDNSHRTGNTARFPLNGVIKGWTEGVQLMVAGEKRRFWIPAELAYGEKPERPGAPAGELVFDIELVSITKMPEPPKPPADLSKVPDSATKLDSGLAYEVMTEGKGESKPQKDATVEMHITGWDQEGRIMIDDPLKFPLEQAPIKGWVDAATIMVKGDKRRFWIPESLAGKHNPGLPKGMLVFQMELLDFRNPSPPPPVPSDVAAIPDDAEKTDSGLASRVLTKGTGDKKPTAASEVTVNYTGWTTDGHMFDSSIVRGEPTSFPLSGVISGWTEGVQLMVVGELRRFWIPAKLAYGENPRPGAPKGMLVFDIELLEIN